MGRVGIWDGGLMRVGVGKVFCSFLCKFVFDVLVVLVVLYVWKKVQILGRRIQSHAENANSPKCREIYQLRYASICERGYLSWSDSICF